VRVDTVSALDVGLRSPLLDRVAAVAADAPDDSVAAHYGDPLGEQRRVAQGPGIVDRSHHGVVRVTGADRLSWLHSLTSQHLTELAPGVPTEALVLSPHGHVEHHLDVVDDGSATWLVVEPGTAPALLEFLDAMRFMLRVDVADVTADYAVVTTLEAGATRHLLVPRAGLVSAVEEVEAAGSTLVGLAAYDALRVAARVPRLGFETDHRTIPHEVGWLETAVHLEKGCYRGQETVARVHNLGRPPRRLVLLHLDGSTNDLPAPGADVGADGVRVGFVTSAARHYELGPIALALIKRTVPDDAVLLAGDVSASIDPTG
jgi:folate-binding protein YgfZ